ncbi:MAG: hypothetical protein ACSW8F_00475 [bacterium]
MKELWKSPEAQRLMKSEEKLSALRKTPGGKKLAALAEEKDLAGAVEKGDTAAVQAALRGFLSSPEGKKLMGELNGIMKG